MGQTAALVVGSPWSNSDVSEIDLTRLPTGEMGWAALIDFIAASDDRVERYFLEVKSDVDLSAKAGSHKVAKFILGAANRDPAQSSKRFGGHALLVLGVGGGAATGIAAFEAKDLAKEVARFTGADGPGWDFERIPVDEDRDVIVVVVDPPTGEIRTCRGDGIDLYDGDIYVRADGETRKATGDEVRSLLDRAVSRTARIDLDVELLGEVFAIGLDHEPLLGWVETEVAELRSQVAPRPKRKSAYDLASFVPELGMAERRSKREFLEEVEEWEAAVRADPTGGVVLAAARFRPGIRLRLVNHTKTFLRDVRIDVELEGDVLAVEWQPEGRADGINLFPGRPKDWGKESLVIGLMPRLDHVAVPSRSQHGNVSISQKHPAGLTMRMDTLRPQEEHVSDDDEVVLVTVVSSDPGGPVRGRWRLTAADINDVFEGQVEIPVAYKDMRAPIEAILARPSGDD